VTSPATASPSPAQHLGKGVLRKEPGNGRVVQSGDVARIHRRSGQRIDVGNDGHDPIDSGNVAEGGT
jgi:ribosomal protein L35AE/L33A